MAGLTALAAFFFCSPFFTAIMVLPPAQFRQHKVGIIVMY
jgi:hypothetical protein